MARSSPGLHLAAAEHASACGIYCDRSCVPDISVSDPHGGVPLVDERGNGTRVCKR